MRVASSGKTSRVARIVTMNGDLPEAAPGLIEYLGMGNRVLFRLGTVRQVAAVASLAQELGLSFEFDPVPGGISILLFRRGVVPIGRGFADDGTGI